MRGRLEERLAALRKEVSNLPETQREVFNFTRDLEVAQEVYLQLLNRAQELRVVKASTIGNVRIVDGARTAPEPVAPRRGRTLALALLLGALSGTGLVLGRAWLRRSVRGPEELDRLGLPVFATVLFAPAAVGNRKGRGLLPILALSDPNSATVEGIRSLRTSLHFGMLDAGSRSIALTSSAPAAGKVLHLRQSRGGGGTGRPERLPDRCRPAAGPSAALFRGGEGHARPCRISGGRGGAR